MDRAADRRRSPDHWAPVVAMELSVGLFRREPVGTLARTPAEKEMKRADYMAAFEQQRAEWMLALVVRWRSRRLRESLQWLRWRGVYG